MKNKILILIGMLFTVVTISAQVPMDGLVLHLPLDGNAKDSSSYANNGTPYYLTPVADRFGKPGKAMNFNGTNSWIEIPSNASINLTKNRTLSAWVYVPNNVTLNPYPCVIAKREPTISYTYCMELCEIEGYNANRYKFKYTSASGTTIYPTYTKQLYTDYKNQWVNVTLTYDTISGYNKIYFNGTISDSTYLGNMASNPSTLSLKIGFGVVYEKSTYFTGNLDDIRLYNRAIDKNEVRQIYLEKRGCTNSNRNDTTVYAVSSPSFQAVSPRYQFIKTDSLLTKTGGCDSIINRYIKFEYKPYECTVTKYITVTDTLIIDLTTGTQSTIIGTLKVYPNPAKDYLNIDFGNYPSISGYLMTIRNELGSITYISPISQGITSVAIKEWGKGLYIVQILDKQNNVVDNRKIIIK